MEQQTQAMCSMFAMLRVRARANITTGRGRERASLCHFNSSTSEADREQGTLSWGFPVLGKATCRKGARRKAVCILREAEQSLVKALLPQEQEPPFRVPPASGMANNSA